MSNIAIEIDKVSKIYKLYEKQFDRLKESFNLFNKIYHKNFYALTDISFTIEKGEVVGIIGKNGSGKSTLLKIISKILTPSCGTTNINGQITALLELGAGFNPELSGKDNIYLNGTIMGFSKDEISAKFNNIVEFAEIGDFIYQPVKTYSSGMKARLGFALAINVEPEILIVDEALSVGDIAFARKCYSKIEHICKNKSVTVLFVSHSSSVIKQLCSRAIMLHDGHMVIDGNAADVVNIYEKFVSSKDIDIDNVKNEFNNLDKQIAASSTSSTQFSDKLLSKSIVGYESNGAIISDIKVVDLNFEKCNILEFSREYYYEYTVEFFGNYDNVKTAMFIKNKHGIEISGMDIPIDEHNILSVKSGSKYLVRWKFKNMFNEGYYFLNAGVNSTIYGEKTILHRVIDAYMFKSNKNIDNHSKGMIDIGIGFDIQEIQH